MRALDHTKKYQLRVARAFNKKVHPRQLQVGDLVLKEQRAPLHDPRGKFKPNWSGPFTITEILPGKAVRLVDLDGEELRYLTNMDQLKKYHV